MRNMHQILLKFTYPKIFTNEGSGVKLIGLGLRFLAALPQISLITISLIICEMPDYFQKNSYRCLILFKFSRSTYFLSGLDEVNCFDPIYLAPHAYFYI